MLSIHIIHHTLYILYCLLFSSQVRFNFRLAFRRSSVFCDQNTINKSTLISAGSWKAKCISGSNSRCNSSEITVGRADFFCTDYSTSEDWTMGGNTFSYTFPSTSRQWSVRYVLLCSDDLRTKKNNRLFFKARNNFSVINADFHERGLVRLLLIINW